MRAFLTSTFLSGRDQLGYLRCVVRPHPECVDGADVAAHRAEELRPYLLDVLVNHPEVEAVLPRLREDRVEQLQVADVLELVDRKHDRGPRRRRLALPLEPGRPLFHREVEPHRDGSGDQPPEIVGERLCYPEYREPSRDHHLVEVELARPRAERPGGYRLRREDEVRYPVDDRRERVLGELGDGVYGAPDYLVLQLPAPEHPLDLGPRHRDEVHEDAVEVPEGGVVVERVEVVEGALEDPHQPRGGGRVGVEDVGEEGGELLHLGLEYLDSVQTIDTGWERERVQPERYVGRVEYRDPLPLRLRDEAHEIDGGIPVGVDEDESDVLPVGEEPAQPEQHRVRLSSAG